MTEDHKVLQYEATGQNPRDPNAALAEALLSWDGKSPLELQQGLREVVGESPEMRIVARVLEVMARKRRGLDTPSNADQPAGACAAAVPAEARNTSQLDVRR